MRTGVFVDVGNLYFTLKERFNGRLDYKKFLEIARGKDDLVHAYAYGAHEDNQGNDFISCLKTFGYTPKFKAPRTVGHGAKKADWDVGIAVDIMKLSGKLDKIVLGTSDGDFAPLVDYIIHHGLVIIVMGCNVSRELKNLCECVEIGKDMLHGATEVSE